MLLIRIVNSRVEPSETEKSITTNVVNSFFKIILEVFLGVFFAIEGIISIMSIFPREKDMIISTFFNHF